MPHPQQPPISEPRPRLTTREQLRRDHQILAA
jgi:hypothetical protein